MDVDVLCASGAAEFDKAQHCALPSLPLLAVSPPPCLLFAVLLFEFYPSPSPISHLQKVSWSSRLSPLAHCGPHAVPSRHLSASPVQPSHRTPPPPFSALVANVTICSTLLYRRGQALCIDRVYTLPGAVSANPEAAQEEEFDPLAADLSVFLSQSILKSPFPGSG